MNLIQPVRKAAGLANIDLVHAVVVDVADGNTVASIDVYGRGRVETRAPVWNALQQLVLVGRDMGEDFGADIAKEGLGRGCEMLLHRREREQLAIGPGLSPMADAIEELAIALTGNFEANQTVRERKELRAANCAESFDPMPPAGGDIRIGCVEDCFVEVGSDGAIALRERR